MNSVQIQAHGVTGFGQMPIQEPGPNQVQIKVHSAVLNPSDILFMRGKYNINIKYPFTPGWEGSGTVVKAGPGMLAQWLVGKRVAFNKQFEIKTFTLGGSMAEYCVTDVKSIIPLGDDISFEQAASLFVNPLTAIGMVDRLKQLNSKVTIVTAAASQIGRMIIKLCHQEGITPICTVRREEQAEFLRNDLKVKYVVNTSQEGWKKQLGVIAMKTQPSSCLECISGEMTGLMMEFMGFGSTVLLYGLLSDLPAGGINTIGFIGKNMTIESFLLTNYLMKMSLAQYMELVLRAEPLYRGDLASVVNKRFGLHQIKEATEFYMANQTAGKVLLQPALTPSNTTSQPKL